ncbi:MAG TPA: hypothetical protein VKX40_17130 [Aequorivita sp.]|nr:hypothetical protein [Aequorivita sp.]
MKKILSSSKYKRNLLLAAIFFIVASISIHSFGLYIPYRLLRALAAFTALIYLLSVHGKKLPLWISNFLIFLGLSSTASLWYENSIMATVTIVLDLASIIVLIASVLPKVKFKQIIKQLSLIFLVVVVINGYLLLQFIGLFKEMTLSNTHYIFIFLLAISIVFLAFLTLAYNHFFHSGSSFVFTGFVFLFIFAEVFRAFGYYELAYSLAFVYLARILLILAICTLVHFTFLKQKEIEEPKSIRN